MVMASNACENNIQTYFLFAGAEAAAAAEVLDDIIRATTMSTQNKYAHQQ